MNTIDAGITQSLIIILLQCSYLQETRPPIAGLLLYRSHVPAVKLELADTTHVLEDCASAYLHTIETGESPFSFLCLRRFLEGCRYYFGNILNF